MKFENEFYILLKTPNQKDILSFLLPNHPSQHPFFHKPFQGEGIYLTIKVDNVDKLYKEIKNKGVEIKVDKRDEPWGGKTFCYCKPKWSWN
ncbi:VOC family protein [Algibacter pectinivorans]|uniref:VOC family protein n=1 Tax=Algibacter pectinivorans TaxID=870482 RepID=UPI003D7A2ABE